MSCKTESLSTCSLTTYGYYENYLLFQLSSLPLSGDRIAPRAVHRASSPDQICSTCCNSRARGDRRCESQSPCSCICLEGSSEASGELSSLSDSCHRRPERIRRFSCLSRFSGFESAAHTATSNFAEDLTAWKCRLALTRITDSATQNHQIN